MIGEFIANYGELGVKGVLVILVSWLVWYLVRSFMGMFKNELVKISDNVAKDSDNTEKVERTMNKLESTISNHLVSSIDNLTSEVRRMNGKK